MHYLWIAMVTASLSLPAFASVEHSLQQCASITQASQRLAGYDQLSASSNSAHTQMNSAPPSSSVVISLTPTAFPTTPATAVIGYFAAKFEEGMHQPEAITLTINSIINQSTRGQREL